MWTCSVQLPNKFSSADCTWYQKDFIRVYVLLPRCFVLVTGHLTSSRVLEYFCLIPEWEADTRDVSFDCPQWVSCSKCFTLTCSNALWCGSSCWSHGALKVSACGCVRSAPRPSECASHSAGLKSCKKSENTVSALVSQHDIGGECIFGDVKSALMTLWLCPKLTNCWRRRPLTDSNYWSIFAAEAFGAIIREIQTIWLVLKVTGHFVGAIFIVANVRHQQPPPALAPTDSVVNNGAVLPNSNKKWQAQRLNVGVNVISVISRQFMSGAWKQVH